MLFKNVENSTNFNFYFDGKLIPLTSDHKHLGIAFSEEAKWNKQNLIKSVSKHICVLRKLKYKLKTKFRKIILNLHSTNICLFEYACEVCGVSNSCKLERLQLEAARIITGLPIFTNTEYLYRETG
jgi:hypothetical protein